MTDFGLERQSETSPRAWDKTPSFISTKCAYAPNVSGCIATGAIIGEVTVTLREAIVEHLEILREMEEEIPIPHSRAGVIQIAS